MKINMPLPLHAQVYSRLRKAPPVNLSGEPIAFTKRMLDTEHGDTNASLPAR
jgi:hypothetical protein